MAMTDRVPPPFPPNNTIELVSLKDSKISSVSLYSSRAEITRMFQLNAKAGLNVLHVVGLPSALDKDSLRVEGRGTATIHDVTISTIAPPPIPTTSETLTDLQVKQRQIEKAIARTHKSLASLEKYIGSLNTNHTDVTKLADVMRNYETTAAALDDKLVELEDNVKAFDESIKQEKAKLSGPTGNEKLNLKATIGVFADIEGEVKVALIYAVRNATWCPGYDVRVDMQSKDKPVTLVYKASITQDTGEDWDDVPLTLETATPTFGLSIPSLDPWTLSVYKYYPMTKSKRGSSGRWFGAAEESMRSAGPMPPPMPVPSGAVMMESDSYGSIQHRGLQVSSRGYINATFGVPGLITLPSDNVGHNVTIVKLSLDATMNWISVPKKDLRVHLKAQIKNASEYTLLPGKSSVYVDGSYISNTEVPLVSPDESFDCPLGLDPTIRITYHPRIKKASQAGIIYNKTSIQTYTQRITVHNAKALASGGSSESFKIKVVDQVPISEDSTISVKLLQPPLVLPGSDVGATGTIGPDGELKLPTPVKVVAGVTANWDGADDVSLGSTANDVDVESVGREGRICWICSVPPQGKANVTLQWEVSAPLKTNITGL